MEEALNQLILDALDAQTIDTLLVQSFEPDIYLAKVVIQGTEYQVYKKPGELLREFSQLALKKHFKPFTITETFLVHDSVYDEMVGNPPASTEGMRVRIANPNLDYS